MPFTHPTELSTCRAHGIIVSFILFATGQGRSPRSLHPLRGTATIASCVPPFKALTCSSESKPERLLINAQTQDACTGAGESVSLPLTSDLAQLLRAEAYLPRFEKKKKQHSGETVGWPASPASIKASPTTVQKTEAILILHRG